MAYNTMMTLAAFAVLTAVYYMIPTKYRWILLLTASLLFYASVQPLLLLVAAGEALYTWVCAGKMHAAGEKQKKTWFLLGLLPITGVLIAFKYLDFLIGTAADVLRLVGLPASVGTLKLLVPLGISYYTFRLISYLADVKKGILLPEKNAGRFLLYTLFFPQILSGPIERAADLLPQFEAPVYKKDLFVRGLQRIVLGLFKKMVIANRLAAFVDTIWADPAGYPALAAWMAAFFYAIQLYCDFSGYSEIALGMSYLMGISCRENFRRPYLASNIKDFWNRWHMSLSSWLKDYIYIPLGGSRCSKAKKCRNVLVTFLVSGIWHGAAWTYILWGAFHGLWNLIGRAWNRKNILIRIFCTIDTFIGVTFGWILFRAPSVHAAGAFISRMFREISLSYDAILASILPFSGDNTCAALLSAVLFNLLILIVYELYEERTEGTVRKLKPLFTGIFFLLVLIFGMFGASGFLYANY